MHLIINNQIGFTTAPEFARSSLYCSDVAKTVQAPIFHVNGDDPEACVRVAKLAFEYRQRFHKDVVIDMWCYRLHGHNEGDDPSYTQPLMYKAIGQHRSVRKLYVEALVKRGDITLDEAEQALADFQARLQVALDETRAAATGPVKAAKPPKPVGVLPHIETGVPREDARPDLPPPDRLSRVVQHPPEARPPVRRPHEAVRGEGEVEWATAEALAFGSLLLEAHSIRLAGEDSRRGTFSQRHAALTDYETGKPWIPLTDAVRRRRHVLGLRLAAVGVRRARVRVRLRPRNPEALVLWEAQFGDFINGAQVIIDQYLVAAEDKWNQRNGLVLLLPHGYEGQGPEHSSARIERFLTAAAEDNIQVCNATTAAQYFHLLRRQVHTERHTPLILFTPKQGLRMRQTRSPIEELTRGSFQEILDDPTVTDRDAVRRIVFCSGKVAWDAMAFRDKRQAARRRGPRRAAVPVADRAARGAAGDVPERPRARLAPGGAGEHGRVEVRREPGVAGEGARLRPPPRRPRRVRQPGDGLEGHPRPGARRPHGRDVHRPLTIRVFRRVPSASCGWGPARSTPMRSGLEPAR